MLKLQGRIEVFKNANGYTTGVIKAFEDKKLLGKAYMDIRLPEEIVINDNETLTLDVKTAYLNAVHVEAKESFTKLQINVVEADIVSVFPERKPEKAKRGAK